MIDLYTTETEASREVTKDARFPLKETIAKGPECEFFRVARVPTMVDEPGTLLFTHHELGSRLTPRERRGHRAGGTADTFSCRTF